VDLWLLGLWWVVDDKDREHLMARKQKDRERGGGWGPITPFKDTLPVT
jgi:hypothetical protein